MPIDPRYRRTIFVVILTFVVVVMSILLPLVPSYIFWNVKEFPLYALTLLLAYFGLAIALISTALDVAEVAKSEFNILTETARREFSGLTTATKNDFGALTTTANAEFSRVASSVEPLREILETNLHELQLMYKADTKTQYMGLTHEVIQIHFEELCKKASVADEVKNTLIFFNLPDEAAERYMRAMRAAAHEHNQEHHDRPHEHNDKRLIIARNVLDKGRWWKDIVSEQVLTTKDGYVRQLMDQLKASFSSYEANVLKASYPSVNMLLFKGAEGSRSEVWFGFGLFGGLEAGRELGEVFRSDDPRLCNYFEKYWDALHADCDDWHALRHSDMEGAWITVAYNADRALRDYAGLRISLKRRELEIQGCMFRPNGEYMGTFRSVATHFKRSDDGRHATLRYAYQELQYPAEGSVSKGASGRRDDLRSEGAGYYELMYDKRDCFEGEFDPKGDMACAVYGKRIREQDDEKAFLDLEWRGIQKVIESKKVTISISKPHRHESPFSDGCW
jgi:hypothetical protein